VNLVQIHEFEKIVIKPRRFEHSVRVYLNEVAEVGNSSFTRSYLLYWPYYWKGRGVDQVIVFPRVRRIPYIPVRMIPDDLSLKPVKIGPLRVLRHRDILLHLQELRIASHKDFVVRRREYIVRKPFPQRKRPNPELINWDGFVGFEDYYTPWQSFPAPTVRWYRAYTSTVTPGYRSKKRGRLPVNPYSLTRIMTEDPPGCDIRYNAAVAPWGPMASSKHYQPSSLWFTLPGAPQHDAAVYNKALAKCITRAEIGLDGNIAQDVAQMGQMVNMVGDSVHRIAAAIHNVKRKNYRDAWECLSTPTTKSRGLGYRVSGERLRNKSGGSVMPIDFRVDMRKSVDVDLGRVVSPLKSVAENWLALQYGWKPLLADIHGALRSFANYCIQEPEVVRSVKSSSRLCSKTTSEVGTTSSWYVKTGELRVATYSSCRMGFRYTIDSKLKAFAAQTGFTNPINLAWEVLPYSFVVDWFLPIGPYLETLSAFDGLAFLDGWVTNATVQYTSGYHNYHGRFPVQQNPEDTKFTKQARYWREYIVISREKLFSFPSATMPTFKNPLSVTHVLNGLALLRAAFK